jgi:outer membrane protein assembly factor BamB
MSKNLMQVFASALGLVAFFSIVIRAQQRGGPPAPDWTTRRSDAQNSSWLRSDAYISAERVRTGKPVFELQWKLQFPNQARQLNSLTAAVSNVGDGRFPNAIIAGSSNNVYGVDTYSGIELWDDHFDAPTLSAPSQACPGGITSGPTRETPLVPITGPVRSPVGISTSAGSFISGVGDPDQGAPEELMRPGRSLPQGGRSAGPKIFNLLDEMMSQPLQTQGPSPGVLEARGGPGALDAPGAAGRGSPGQGGPLETPIGGYVISSDGVLHALGPLRGKEVRKPVPFLPPNAQVADIILVNNTLYAATTYNCGGVSNALWAINLADENKTVISWKTDGGSPIGSPAFGSDGTAFVAIGAAPADASAGYSDAVVALDSKTLAVKDWFTQRGANFTAAPVIFKYKEKEMVAVATREGRIFLLDTTSLGGGNHQTPVFVSDAVSAARTDFAPSAVASWEDSNGTRWLLEPVEGPIRSATRIPAANGTVTNGAVVAFKVDGEAAQLVLKPAWVSRDMVSPLAPIVVNGVVFAASSGEYHAAANGAAAATAVRVSRSVRAIVYALDPDTGKEWWNSGKSITSFVHSGSLWASSGQVYIGTYDNMLYAFGYAVGRH